jgi:hypothetical protein
MPLSGIRNHDPSFQESEDSSCLRPRVSFDRHILLYIYETLTKPIYIYKSFVSLRFFIITQFVFTTATNCQHVA